jgi:hypothetical protein
MAQARAREIAQALAKNGVCVEIIHRKKDGTMSHVSRVQPSSARARKIVNLAD